MKYLIILTLFLPLISYSQINTESIAEGNNKFAFDIYKALKQENKNLFVSPFSISTAFAMTYAGAKNETASEIAKTLYYGKNNSEFHESFAATIKTITNENNDAAKIFIANRIWAQNNYTFKDDYFQLTKTQYNAPVKLVNFINEQTREKARVDINEWVENETNNKITKLIKPGILDQNTRMVLVNALYFFAQWETQFDTTRTKSNRFFLSDGSQVDTKFMNKTFFMYYGENEMAQFIELPYKNKKASLVVILPKEKNKLSNLEKSLNYEYYTTLLSSTAQAKIDLSLPKFTIENDFELEDIMKNLGISTAFSPDADFSGMTGKKELKISKVIHKTYIDLNEQGTEAAAATAIIMERKSNLINNKEPIVFNADHPFIIILKENTTQNILFIGCIENPK